jgi:hydrogenase expression/formation protein HypD
MKYIDEYRNYESLNKYLKLIQKVATRPWTIMELCGGQTHSIVKYRIQELIPPSIRLVHGPGCPVCVTSLELIDKAIEIALQPEVIFCSFGDMLRVPGSEHSLLMAKAEGADIRIVYSPMDALAFAHKFPDREIVFFGVGFETTAPAIAMSIYQSRQQQLTNFSVLCSHFLVPPAMEAILDSPRNVVQGFLAAGHVCTIMGYEEYFPISSKFQVPIVVTGFEPLDIVEGLYLCIKQLEEARHEVENQYVRSVQKKGNVEAQKIMNEVFEVVSRKWRGIGPITHSGLGISRGYQEFDAETRFSVRHIECNEHPLCISAEILQGFKTPHQCPAFGSCCTPENPLGAPMVSSEGACAAYHRYQGVHHESIS